VGQERIAFTSGDRSLQGTLRLPDSPAVLPCVVLCHGFGSYDDDLGGFIRLADFLAGEGMASFRFSFSGSHPYPDKGTILPASQWVNDALSALARAGQHPRVDPNRLGLLGVSVGGGVVIQAAALDPAVRTVVALAPVADGMDWLRYRWCLTRGEAAWRKFLEEVDADHRERVMGKPGRRIPHFDVQALADRPAWEALLERFPNLLSELSLSSVHDTLHFKPLFFARSLSQPLCLVHGDADESVPLEHSRRVHDTVRGEKTLRILAGSPHCPWDTPHEAQFQQIAGDWFRQRLG
jgi:uncharacterized protein